MNALGESCASILGVVYCYYILKVGFLYNINIVNLIYKVELAETEISIHLYSYLVLLYNTIVEENKGWHFIKWEICLCPL